MLCIVIGKLLKGFKQFFIAEGIDSGIDFMYGSLNLSNVVFFLSVIAIFLYLSIQSLEKRRWS